MTTTSATTTNGGRRFSAGMPAGLPRPTPTAKEKPELTDLSIRTATTEDAEALHALITGHEREGHLLPRSLDEVRRHAGRFIVCDVDGEITACGELAPLSTEVAEVRSLATGCPSTRIVASGAKFDPLALTTRSWLPARASFG